MSRKRATVRALWLAPLLAAALVLTPAAALADDMPAREAGVGAAAALSSLLYGPVKLCYAIGGSVIAGLAWAFSAGDAEVAKPILNAALRGDYVVTASHIQGERPLEFVGRSPDQRRMQLQAERIEEPYDSGF